MSGKRKKSSAGFKAKGTLEALRGDATTVALAIGHGVRQTGIDMWKRPALEGMAGVFSGKAAAQTAGKEGGQALQ